MNRPDVYNREKLYAEVWSHPVIRIAPSYGISDVALAKICRRLLIPLPGRGYWAKQAHGHFVKREPLPELSNVPVITKRRTVESMSPLTEEQKDPALIRIEQLEKFPSQSITSRRSDDQLLAKATAILKTARTDDRHILRAPWKEACLDIRVSKQSLPRALCIMGNLIGVLKAEGLNVTLDPTKSESTRITVFGEEIQFGLVERVRRVELPAPPQSSPQQHKRILTFCGKPIDYMPTGELAVQVWSYCSETLRKNWKDTRNAQLESLLHHCVAGFMRIGLALRRRTEELRRKELDDQKRLDEYNELKRQIETEEARIKQLESAANNWKRAQAIRDYVMAVERDAIQQGGEIDAGSETGRWLEWARQQADRVDPIAKSAPSILDKKTELARLREAVKPWYL